MKYRVYVNNNCTAVGFRGQYALPDTPLLADEAVPEHIREIERIPNVSYIRTVGEGELNHFEITLEHMFKTKNHRIRILFRREVGIGDVLLSALALESLYYKYRKNIVIDYWAPFAPAREVLWFNPNIRQIFDNSVTSYEQIADAFDIFVDLHKHVGHKSAIDFYEPEVYEQMHWPKVNKGRAEIWCEYFGVEPIAYIPKIYLSPGEIEFGKAAVRDLKIRPNRPVVGLATEATSPDKCLSEKVVVDIAHRLNNEGFNVFLIGKHTKDIKGPFVNCNKHSVRTVCAMMKAMNVVMTYESMLGHLAAAAGVPQLCVYGRFDGRQSMGKYPFIKFFGIHGRLGPKCPTGRPCWHSYPGQCRLECVRNIKPDDVAGKIVAHYEDTKSVYRP